MGRRDAFKDALLNTCVRLARDTYPELTLRSCWANTDFLENARLWLHLPFFNPIEPTMEDARKELVRELSIHLAGAGK